MALPDGYSIVQALGINDPGQIIVTATRDPRGAGVYQTFLLTPVPGPGAAACAALGAAALLARRRRRR